MSGSCAEALLLVDGYNIIGAWPSLKKLRDKHSLEAARDRLVENLINFTVHRGYETQVVFDAQYQKNPLTSELIFPNFSVYYTAFSQTADTYIERSCATFDGTRIIVATSDEDQRRTVVGYGAECISALTLLSEVNSAFDKIKRKKAPNRAGRHLADTLSPTAKAILDQWVGRTS